MCIIFLPLYRIFWLILKLKMIVEGVFVESSQLAVISDHDNRFYENQQHFEGCLFAFKQSFLLQIVI